MTRRAFFGLSSVMLALMGVLLLALAWQARTRHGGLFGRRDVSACPYLNGSLGETRGPAAESLRAFAAIEAALAGESLRGVPENAARIARFFREINPDIAASARRLTRMREVPAARTEFRRLTDLFSHPPDVGAPAGDSPTPRPLLEI